MTDMAEAFGVFANMGYRIPLHPILKVTDFKGNVIDEYKPPSRPMFAGKKVIPEGVAFIISNILSDNNARMAAFGPSSPLKIGNYPISVKTGTTNDYRDNWTIGYTPDYVVAVWVGNNDNTPMSGVVSGITGAAPIWHNIMAELVKRKTPKALPKPDTVVGRSVCNDGSTPPEGSTCASHFEYFMAGNYKTGAKTERKKVFIDKGTQDLAKPGQTDNVEEQEKTIVTDALGDQYCVDCAHPEANPSPTPHP
jgi:membrane peptidoglycan carboxypeptidase